MTIKEIDIILNNFPKKGTFTTYVEPFFEMGEALIRNNDFPPIEIINDNKRAVGDFFRALENDDGVVSELFVTNKENIKGYIPQTRDNVSDEIREKLGKIDGLFEMYDRLSRLTVLNRNPFDLIERFNDENAFIFCNPTSEWGIVEKMINLPEIEAKMMIITDNKELEGDLIKRGFRPSCENIWINY